MNTRLQVEHGITELCYDVDLVELMLRQADAQLSGHGGLSSEQMKSLQPSGPTGAAIEARIYAENPLRDYAPSPGTRLSLRIETRTNAFAPRLVGLLQKVEWEQLEGSRIDTWVSKHSRVAPAELLTPICAVN